MNTYIAPSILSADFSRLGEELSNIKQAGLEMVHIDVMDGHFVPNLTIGPVVIKDLRPLSDLTFDVHLMISEPQKYIEAFAAAGSDIITVHAEAEHDLADTVKLIHSFGKKAGVSINPDTPVSAIEDLFDSVDLVLLMTVFPGFGGQSFIESVMPKVAQVCQKLQEIGRRDQVLVEVDGGINDKTAAVAHAQGANVFVAGNYVFSAEDIAQPIAALQNALSFA